MSNPFLTVDEFQGRSLGHKGYDLLGVGAHPGTWYALQAYGDDAVIESGTEANGSTVTQTIDKGDVVYGQFTAVTLTSGTIRAYRA